MLAEENQDPLDAFVTDPSGRPPLGSEDEFAAILDGMVAANAPRRFAVVQEYGDRVDARIAGWGIAFDDHADVIGEGNVVHFGVPSPEDVLRCFRFGTRVTPRLVWVDPAEPEVSSGRSLSRHR
jgi:hypothetical protein